MTTPIRLVLAEDNEDDVILLLSELRSAGFDPDYSVVTSAPEMVEAFSNGHNLDLVISDYSMPSFSGLDALRIAKNHDVDIPFIMVSGTVGEEVAVEVMRSGAQDFLVKGSLARLGPAILREIEDSRLRRERKRAELALQDSEANWASLVKSMPGRVVLTNFDGEISFINRVSSGVESSVVGKTMFDFVDKSDHDDLRDAMRRVRESGKHVALEFSVDVHGEQQWWSFVISLAQREGRAEGFLVVANDISDRKKAEHSIKRSHEELECKVRERTAELQEANDRLRQEILDREKMENSLRRSESENRALLNAIPDMMFIQTADGVYQSYHGPKDAPLLAQPDEFIGRNVRDVLPEPLAGQVLQKLREALVSEEPVMLEYELPVKGADSSAFEARLARLNDQEVLVIIRDITERRRVDEMKEEFISTVSHELRTPLTSIRGSLGLLVGGVIGELPDNVRELLRIADNNTHRLLELINDILDVSKLENGHLNFEFKPCPIGPVLEHARETNLAYASQLGVTIRVETRLDQDLVYVDWSRFDQVLSNLLSNAAKFSGSSSEVVLSAVRVGDMVRVAVLDQGVGVSREFSRRVFEKFTQSDGSDSRGAGGTGLGLYISRHIIEAHGGRLDFVSTPGVGSCFFADIHLATKVQPSPGGVSWPAIAVEPRILWQAGSRPAQLIAPEAAACGYVLELYDGLLAEDGRSGPHRHDYRAVAVRSGDEPALKGVPVLELDTSPEENLTRFRQLAAEMAA